MSMMSKAVIAVSLLSGAAPALADSPVMTARETYIPNMAGFLEWVADGERGVYIRGDTGRWYYARTKAPCPRLRSTTALSFQTTNGDLDRFGSLRIRNWRCPLLSVVESGPPPERADD
jgi:hypothetical protein